MLTASGDVKNRDPRRLANQVPQENTLNGSLVFGISAKTPLPEDGDELLQ
jgi:hypothetical protein